MFIVFIKLPLVIAAISFIDSSDSMFHIVGKRSGVDSAVFIEIFALSMLFIFKPIANIKFSFSIIVFAFPMFHTIMKLSLISFFVWIEQ